MTQHAALPVPNSKGMGRVIDHPQTITPGYFPYGIDIARHAIAVHGQDRAGTRGDRCFNSGWIKVEGLRVDIDKHRR